MAFRYDAGLIQSTFKDPEKKNDLQTSAPPFVAKVSDIDPANQILIKVQAQRRIKPIRKRQAILPL
jgi:hypothetical protein